MIPELGLYTGMIICGAVGSGKTSACMRPFARQLLGWQADDPRRRIAGLVLEVKGDFCHQVRGILEDAGRGEDYVELGLGGRWQWNPLGDDQLDSYSLAYTVASLINQLFGRSKEPFWQQAYVNLVRWIIELHRMRPARWVTLRDVYRCTLDPRRIEKLIAEVEASVAPPATVRIRIADLARGGVELKAWSWKPVGDGDVRTTDDAALREKLTALGITFEAGGKGAADPERRERLDAIQRWYRQDWMMLDPKLRSSIIEGLSVFLSVFDLPEVAGVFCPPRRPEDAPAASTPDADTAAVVRPLPRLDEVIDSGKVLCLNMPAGTNPALSRAVGVMLKQAWLQTLLRRPAEMARRPQRVFRPAVFLCDEYQTFATVGEDDPAGDEKAFALTRQSRLNPDRGHAVDLVAAGRAGAVGGVAGADPDAAHAHLSVARGRCVGADRQHVLRAGVEDEGQLQPVGADRARRPIAALGFSRWRVGQPQREQDVQRAPRAAVPCPRLHDAGQLSGHRDPVRRQAGRRRTALLPQARLSAAGPAVLASPRGRRPVGVEAAPRGRRAVLCYTFGPAERQKMRRGATAAPFSSPMARHVREGRDGGSVL